MSILLTSPFFAGFMFVGVGHAVFSSFLQVYFYRRQASDPHSWKVQPEKAHNLREEETRRCWLPLLSLVPSGRDKSGRHRLHGLFATVNVLMGACSAGALGHCFAEGKTKVFWDTEVGFSWLRTATGLALALIWHSVMEYYMHRFMHLRPVYRRLHKYHHFYKSPEPFDDLMMHPLESLGYLIVLYAPAFLWAMPVSSLALYLMTCSTCAILDHSGVSLAVPGLYHSLDHDLHHSRIGVNYAFPFPFMDIVHDTYEGNFLFRRYSAAPRPKPQP